MPSLDLSDAFLEPSFLDTFQVVRRKEVVNLQGRSTIIQSLFNATGTVDSASPNDLQRLGDYQFDDDAISIVTRTRLFDEARQIESGAEASYQPDLIFWAGAYYIIKALDNYTRFGIGWVQAICVETTYVSTPVQEGQTVSMFNFQVPSNSGNVACF